jgi:transcriptional regulator with XRE-family HTH domain
MGPSHAKLPRTGEELKTWRKKRGWSQGELAQRLKVGIATIKRAEQRPTEPLGPSLAEALPALKDEPEMVELPAPEIPDKGSKR